MSKDDEITPEERNAYAKYMREADQVFAWAKEHETEILTMILTKEFTDDPEFLTNIAIVAMHGLTRHRADVIKDEMEMEGNN